MYYYINVIWLHGIVLKSFTCETDMVFILSTLVAILFKILISRRVTNYTPLSYLNGADHWRDFMSATIDFSYCQVYII